MTTAEELLAAQHARLDRIDPRIPHTTLPGNGEVLTAALPDGTRVAGVVVRLVYPERNLATLWSASQVFELVPLIGASGGAGMDALLRALRNYLDKLVATDAAPQADSSCSVVWPSRDIEASAALLAHGLVPLTVLAVRPPGPAPDETELARQAWHDGLKVRRAAMPDLDVMTQLAMAELEYSSMVGGAIRRPKAAVLKRDALRGRLDRGDPMWLAEKDGMAVAIAECGWSVADSESWRGSRLPRGRWGFTYCMSVLPGARGVGIGRQLMAVVHREFQHEGAIGTYLYYNPPNPLSSVFWPRQGYSPLWTGWEARPATVLR